MADASTPRFWKSADGKPDVPVRSLVRGGHGQDHHGPGHDELPASGDDGSPSRRRFLTLLGASAALATGAACRTGDRSKLVPYTRKPKEIVPGIADYYASTFQEGELAYPVLVKAREGRPIHVQGNDEHPELGGKTSFHAIADLLALYDPDRLRGPSLNGRTASWSDATAALTGGVRDAVGAGKDVLLVTGAVISPARARLLGRLREAIPTLRHLQWEPAADHTGRSVERELYGDVRLQRLHLDRAKVIVSFEADVLGTQGDTVAATRQIASGRRPGSPGEAMNRLYVFEGGMSLTGSKADVRHAARPSQLPAIAFAVAAALQRRSGRELLAGTDPGALAAAGHGAQVPAGLVERVAADLATAGPDAVALAGPAAPASVHAACHAINELLGSTGNVIDVEHAVPAPALATPAELGAAVRDMKAGQVGAAIFWDANPAYDHPESVALSDALANVPVRVRIGLHADETAALCGLVLAANHWLESWNDFQTSSDLIALQQPLVSPLHDSRQGEEILLGLLAALGKPAAPSWLEFLRQRWRDEVFPRGTAVSFDRFWQSSVHDGLVRRPQAAPMPARRHDGRALARLLAAPAPASSAFELVIDVDPRLHDGRHANNGWLQELPDPVHKASWGNPLAVAPHDARRLGLRDGDVVALNGVETPVVIVPGQAPGVLRLAMGHGRTTGSVAAGVGTRAAPLADGGRVRPVAALEPTGQRGRPLHRSQEHFTVDGREIARLWSREEYAREAHAHRAPEPLPSLYPEAEAKSGPRWGMAIDLSSCVGCSGCVVACQSENNVPVVGPEQVERGRAMHWLRIDRYHEGSSDEPRVVHEPMLCQQCGNAPCENVCPVQATNHSPDGLNQMAYNRCVGTRYCGNNCPYKVRRFNFLDFTGGLRAPLELAMNPEVTVRPRGVMEKCTFCVQRIRNAEQVARNEGRSLADGDVQPACAVACPAEAIVFGNLNDPDSAVSKLTRSDRGFRVLEELGVKPSITYLAALTNPPAGKTEGGGGGA